jgi:tRNA U34 5-methylaminomethyl-2-thiouridine-forming methyltransferase MnmC
VSGDLSDAKYHELDWTTEGVPVSRLFDDPFYSRNDGRAETDYVFLDGNGLPDRWRDRETFSIGELGFGTGLNFLETWRLWCESRAEGQSLSFTSFEKFPLQGEEIARALSVWPELSEFCDRLVEIWRSEGTFGQAWQIDAQTQLQIVAGDALAGVTNWAEAAEAWYLDGFSPAKNQGMWSEDLMQAVFEHTRPGGTFATYTSAGWVRRNLQAAGFEIAKRPGHAGKREMMLGRRPL